MAFMGMLRSWVSGEGPAPAGGAPRVQARYDAGGSGVRTRAWNPPDAGPVAATLTAPKIRARARDACRNDGAARAIVESWTDDVCGWGFTPRSKARDAALRDKLHALWAVWSETAGSAGEDFAALVALVVRGVLMDGEAFVRRRPRKPEDGLAVPLALEVIDPARVPHDMTRSIDGGSIVQGIELDLLGRVVAYHVLDHVPGEPVTGVISAEPRRVPASAMSHVFDQERPGQRRGVSSLATALPRLRTLDLWNDATLERLQLANLFVAFVRAPATAESSVSPLTGMPPDDTHEGRPVMALSPGIFQELGPGEQVDFSEPPDPPASGDFAREQLRLACIAAGVPLEVVTGNWGGTNDRLARVVLHQWRRRVERFRWSVLVPQLLRPIWNTWIGLSGLAPDAEDRRVQWMPHAWPYIHPTQDVAATVTAIRAGLTSLSAAVAEASGEDAEAVLAAIAADNKRADELGIQLDSDGRKAKGGAV